MSILYDLDKSGGTKVLLDGKKTNIIKQVDLVTKKSYPTVCSSPTGQSYRLYKITYNSSNELELFSGFGYTDTRTFTQDSKGEYSFSWSSKRSAGYAKGGTYERNTNGEVEARIAEGINSYSFYSYKRASDNSSWSEISSFTYSCPSKSIANEDGTIEYNSYYYSETTLERYRSDTNGKVTQLDDFPYSFSVWFKHDGKLYIAPYDSTTKTYNLYVENSYNSWSMIWENFPEISIVKPYIGNDVICRNRDDNESICKIDIANRKMVKLQERTTQEETTTQEVSQDPQTQKFIGWSKYGSYSDGYTYYITRLKETVSIKSTTPTIDEINKNNPLY